MNDLRTGFLERHRKQLHEAIDIVPLPAKRACLEKAQEDPVGAPPSIMPHSDEVEEEARGTEAGQDAAVAEGVPDEKGNPAPAAPPTWKEMMEMLKRVSCFTDVEAPSTKMSDFFPLTKRISSRGPKEADGGAVSGPTYLKERDGGRICHSEEGVGDEISKCSNLEDSGLCLVIVMSSRPLLVFIPLTLYNSPDRGQTYFRGDDYIHAVCKSERSVTRGSPRHGRVLVRRYSFITLVHSWLSYWLSSIALQAGASVMKGLVCTYMGNNMASLMGNEILSLETDSVSARSNPDRMVSYSASLFDVRNPNRMACSSCSPVGDCSRIPTLDLDDRETPSTCKVHYSTLSSSPSRAGCWGDSTTKSAITCPFMDSLDRYSIPYSLNSIAHCSILLDRSSLCRMLRRGWFALWQLSVYPIASAFLSTRKNGCNLSVNRAMKRPNATSLPVRRCNSFCSWGRVPP
ncbi:hypothetical protein CK203_099618 [Vitis vinifera]|uniref:Uncharacterized protein n=1 Tax=Vitis vinifera TaxID=29760 RepID=A0A438E924_VITVI|nr:hypothetical protein CK203_099618 [Vitis vinifera]